MIRSLYSGVSGMKNHQIRMDVVGNNISNVNTTGYKAGRTNFQDTLYQTIKSGGKSTNPAQAGLGINVASINNYMTPGPLQGTSRTLDLAINGNGFFQVTDGVDNYYTRDGIFFIDQEGYLVNSDGLKLIGELSQTATAVGESFAMVTSDEDSNPTTLTILGTLSDGTIGEEKNITIESAKSPSISAGTDYTINAGTVTLDSFNFADGDEIRFNFINPYVNPPINESFTITIDDADNRDLDWLANEINNESGGSVEMAFTTNDGSDRITFNVTDAYGPGSKLTISTTTNNTVFDGADSDFTGGTASKTGSGDDINSIIDKINDLKGTTGVEASKDKDNKLVLTTLDRSETSRMTISGNAADYLGWTGGVTIDSDRNVETTFLRINKDSLPVGTLSIQKDGSIIGYDTEGYPLQWDGESNAADISRIVLYGFNNQDGLNRVNQNLFEQNTSSGEATKGSPGSPGYGTIESGYLEMSNVQLTDEFTNMIVTQRGYQANSRIITVSDTMLEELINLKR